MDASDIERAVAAACEAEPAVLAAWVFGSRARGEARRDSDLDVAVLTDDGVPGLEERLAGVIGAPVGLDVDVSRIDRGSPIFAYEVLADGRRVFCRDDARVDAAEERMRRQYLDTEHLRRVQRHYLYGDPL